MTTTNSDDNLQFVDNFMRLGINITSHRTKLAKRVYLMISLTYLSILIVGILKLDTLTIDLLKDITSLYSLIVVLVGILLIFAIIFMPESHHWSLTITIGMWICWIYYLSCLICSFRLVWPDFLIWYIVFVIHHLIMTVVVMLKQQFEFELFWANLIISVGGILYIGVQRFFKFDHAVYYVLLGLQYILVNLLYFFLIFYFANIHKAKFWKRRKGLTFFLIFTSSNLSLLFLSIFIPYWIYQRKQIDHEVEKSASIDIIHVDQNKKN